MKNPSSFLLFTLLILFFGCSAAFKDIKVDAEANPAIDLTKYKTYMWGGSAELVVDDQGKWVPPEMDVNAELRYLINKELRKMGFTEVAEKPDMIIATAVGVHMDALKIKEDPDTKMKLLKNVPRSALVITMIDALTDHPIWIGMATGDVRLKGDQERKMRLEYAVKEILEKFPH